MTHLARDVYAYMYIKKAYIAVLIYLVQTPGFLSRVASSCNQVYKCDIFLQMSKYSHHIDMQCILAQVYQASCLL